MRLGLLLLFGFFESFASRLLCLTDLSQINALICSYLGYLFVFDVSLTSYVQASGREKLLLSQLGVCYSQTVHKYFHKFTFDKYTLNIVNITNTKFICNFAPIFLVPTQHSKHVATIPSKITQTQICISIVILHSCKFMEFQFS